MNMLHRICFLFLSAQIKWKLWSPCGSSHGSDHEPDYHPICSRRQLKSLILLLYTYTSLSFCSPHYCTSKNLSLYITSHRGTEAARQKIEIMTRCSACILSESYLNPVDITSKMILICCFGKTYHTKNAPTLPGNCVTKKKKKKKNKKKKKERKMGK